MDVIFYDVDKKVRKVRRVSLVSTHFKLNSFNVHIEEIRSGHFGVFPVQGDSKRGFLSPFFVKIPQNIRRDSLGRSRLVVECNNVGPSLGYEINIRKSFFGHFQKEALRRFDEMGQIYFTPVFPRSNKVYTHALSRKSLETKVPELKRVDLQLIAMVELLKRLLFEDAFGVGSIEIKDKFNIIGFSAAGQFASRFSILHSTIVNAALFGSPGGFPLLPISSFKGVLLPYPIGISDIEQLTGKAFDIDAFKKVKLHHYMGDHDTNDAVDFPDAFSKEDKRIIDSMFGPDPIDRWVSVNSILKEVSSSFMHTLFPGADHNSYTTYLELEKKFIQDNF